MVLYISRLNSVNYWGYERASAFHVMKEKYGYPVLSIDRPYAVGTSGQLRREYRHLLRVLRLSVSMQEGNYKYV